MKVTIDGKRYDTDKCEELGEYDLHSVDGNYTGTRSLLRASDGVLLIWTNTNGQDLHMQDQLRIWDDGYARDTIDYYDLSEGQEKRCEELGLLKMVN